MFKQWYSSLTEWVDRRIGWSKLPWPLGLLVILGLRFRLRAKNLYDSGRGALDVPPPGDEWHVDHLTARTIDGTYNDLEEPLMGGLGSRFGRNVPLDHAYPDPDDRLLEPDPRRVSLELLTRDEFIPATTLNLLAGAWIQFEVHDWFSHGQNQTENPWRIELGRRRSVAAASDGDPADAHGPERGSRRAAHFRHRRHALVGRLADLRQRARLRAGDPHRRGRQDPRLAPTGCCRRRSRHTSTSAVSPATSGSGSRSCTRSSCSSTTRSATGCTPSIPDLDDQTLYEKARLVNAALMAKIHTVDWTPAIIAHPTTIRGAARELVRACWASASTGSSAARTSNEILRGIPGSPSGATTASRTR